MSSKTTTAALVAVLASNSSALADVTINLAWESVLDMVQPIRSLNIAAHDQMTVVLRDDRSISQQGIAESTGSQRTYSSSQTLGVGWRVVSQNTLSRTIGFGSNNRRIMTVTINGKSCKLKVVDVLNPGYSTYVFPRARNGQPGEFSRVVIRTTSCTIQ